jgi:hypothetical protein
MVLGVYVFWAVELQQAQYGEEKVGRENEAEERMQNKLLF